MSLLWLLKSIDLDQYEKSGHEISPLDREIVDSEATPLLELVLALNTSNHCIASLILETEELDQETKRQIRDKLIEQLSDPDMSEDGSWCESSADMLKFRRRSAFSLRLLNKIYNTELNDQVRPQLINTLSYYTDIDVPWSCDLSLTISNEIINKLLETEAVIVSNLKLKLVQLTNLNKTSLKNTKNPIFLKIRSNVGFLKNSSMELDKWTMSNIKIISPLKYLIANGLVSENLNVIVPLLLNFVDYHDIDIKVQGCKVLKSLVDNYSEANRYKTLFVESVSKCLMYVPPLTDVPRSLRLLEISYGIAIKLEEGSPDKLFELIQDDVLTSIISTGDKSFEITEFLLGVLLELIPQVKQKIIGVLSSLLPQLFNILTDVYLLSRPSLLLADIAVLQEIIRYCWPIMDKYRYDYLASILICYKRLEKKHSDVINRLQELSSVLRGCCDIEDDLSVLVSKDSSLLVLFHKK